MKPTATSTVSRQVLTTLTAAVLLIHALLLKDSARNMAPGPPLPAPAFNTRALALTPVLPAKPAQQVAATRVDTPPMHPGATSKTPIAPTVVASPAVIAPDALAQAPEPAPTAPASQEALSPARSYRIPPPVRLLYEVTGNRLPAGASAELLWQHDGASYDASLSLRADQLPLQRQTSRGQITALGLAPLRFSDKKRSELAAHFVRAQGKVSFSANTPDASLLADAQDRLSVLLQLAALFAGDPAAYPQSSTLTLPVVGPRDADIWLFSVGPEEPLALPGGPQTARKLLRRPQREFDPQIEVWLAPALGYLPVRLRITLTNGDFIDQQWRASQSAP